MLHQAGVVALLSRVSLVAVAALAVTAGGCASSKSTTRTYAQVAPDAAVDPVAKKAEVEDDGLPPQLPPPRIRRTGPDDPREPYSPNYGKTAQFPRSASLTTGSVTPVASLARVDEDAIITRAILAHEQRYR